MEHHSVQSPHGWELLGVQLSSTVAVPASEPAKISLSRLDVCVSLQITLAISICTTSQGLAWGEWFPSAYASLGMPPEQPGMLSCVCWWVMQTHLQMWVSL